MSGPIRSEPLGWLAPSVVAPPAAALGALVGAVHDDSAAVQVIGAVTGLVLAVLAGLWGARERSAWRLFGRFVASSTLAGGIGLTGARAAPELAEVAFRFDPWGSAMLFSYGCLLGLAYGLIAGLVLALMLRMHRGPRAAARALFVGGAGWAIVAIAMLTSVERSRSVPAALLLAAGLTAMIFSPLARARVAAPPVPAGTIGPTTAHLERPRRLGALLLLGPGFVLGLVVLARVIPREMMPGGWIDLLAASTAPALLAALTGAWSMGARSPLQVGLRALVACLAAGALCAPLTYLALVASTWGHADDRIGVSSAFVVVSLFGGAIGAPIGLALGVPFGAAGALVSRLCRGALATPIARAAVGASWIAAGIAAVSLTAVPSLDLAHEPDAFSWLTVWAAIAVMAIGLGVAAPATLRLARAWRLLARARAGELPEYAVVARSALDADDDTIAALPAYLPFGRLDGVLVRRHDPAAAPFRDATLSAPVARVPA